MRNDRQTRRILLGALLAASAMGSSVQAQDQAGRPPRPGNQAEVVINCCRCIGEESGAVNLSTGTAPWTVSSTATPTWESVAPWQANPTFNGPINTSPQVVPGNLGVNPLPNVWTNALAPAAWLHPNPTSSMGSYANGHYTYTLKIRVPNCAIKQKVKISGRIAADDVAKMYLDGAGGRPIPLPPGPFAGFATAWSRNFAIDLGPNPDLTPPGVYTIRVEVDNLGGGPTGIVLNGIAQGKCDDRKEKGKDERD